MKRRTFVRSSFGAALATSLGGRSAYGRPFRPVGQEIEDVEAVTGDGASITIKGTDIADLAARLRGRVLLTDDAGYDVARQILNPSFDRYPALIAQVTGTADVRVAVDFAREHSLLTAVKCGGHSASGKSTCDRGMMIDLSPFRSVRIDPANRRAWVAGGSLLGQLDHESMAYGLVTPMGTVSHTGVGGLVTGGGFGRVARRFGMSVDNLRAVDVVTADGGYRQATQYSNSDLFWGVRGGGGNFGIVTAFEFQLHPMQRQVVAGQIMFPIERAKDVLRMYGDYAPQAPDELDLSFVVVRPPGGAPGVAGFGVCYSGPESRAESALEPLRRLGTPVMDSVTGMDYVAVQRSGDTDDPRGRGTYLKSGFFREMPEALIDTIVDGLEGHPDRSTVMACQQSGGAINRVASDATAFPYRNVVGNLLGVVDWAHGSDPSDHISWARQYWATVEPFTVGFYNNDGDPEATAEEFNRNYQANRERLVAIKNRYDPTNLFRLNANIQPTV